VGGEVAGVGRLARHDTAWTGWILAAPGPAPRGRPRRCAVNRQAWHGHVPHARELAGVAGIRKDSPIRARGQRRHGGHRWGKLQVAGAGEDETNEGDGNPGNAVVVSRPFPTDPTGWHMRWSTFRGREGGGGTGDEVPSLRLCDECGICCSAQAAATNGASPSGGSSARAPGDSSRSASTRTGKFPRNECRSHLGCSVKARLASSRQ